MSSDTPLTNGTKQRFFSDSDSEESGWMVPMDFARQLERDLATARQQLDSNIDICKQVQAERDTLRQQLEAARDENFVFKEIAELIGTIYVHGNFIAETFNEKELEKRLRKVGCFWDSIESYDAHKFPELETRRQG